MQKMCPRCRAVAETEGNFCPQCGGPYQQFAAPPSTPASASPAASPIYTIAAVALGALGIMSTFMTWLTYEDYHFNGWDSRAFPDYYDLYSAGPTVTLLFSIALAAGGVGHLIRGANLKRPYRPSDRVGVGVVTLVAGVVLLGNAIAQFGAFDEAAKLDYVYVEAGGGLQVSGLVGVLATVLGILVLTVKALIPTSEGQ